MKKYDVGLGKPAYTLTIKDFLKEKTPQDKTNDVLVRSGVYVIHDGDMPLYIGMSESGVFQRMQQHLGLSPFPGSVYIDEVIEANAPASSSWQVDIYETPRGRALWTERELISQHAPLCNTIRGGCTWRRDWPAKYKVPAVKDVNADKIAKAFGWK